MYIGIDLGTSNSVIAGFVDNNVRVFRPADGGEVLPSVIFADKRGHRLYGRRAYDQGLIAPENVASGFKRLMGTATPIEIKGAEITMTAEECSADIIRQLLGQASTETGEEDFDGAIITVPAAFNQMQSEATLRAAKAAGLDNVDLLQEPVAAALASMAGAKRSGKFLIYDLGGGTFDLALAEAVNGEVTILAQQGINMLGGRDFDRMIVNTIIRPWLIANFDLPDNFQRDPAYRRLIRVAQMAAEKAKIDLSTNEEASIFASDDEVRMMDQSEAEIFLDAPITRAQLEELIREPIMQTIAMIRALLEEKGVSAEDIDRIVFIGGPTRAPVVRQMVADELGITADLKTDPMTAVAIGAAYYAESREWTGQGTTAAVGTSSPKSTAAPAQTPAPTQTPEPAPATKAPSVLFNYTQRTAEDNTVITVHTQDGDSDRQLRMISTGWDSGLLPLTDGLTVLVPLPTPGAHTFEVRLMDASGAHIAGHDQTLTITRVVASAGTIHAAQTIAVKALASQDAKENVLHPLITKGAALPCAGQAPFKSSRDLKAGTAGSISFELFQVEYPERVDLNLCVGLFRIEGRDLPPGAEIRAGDPVVFDWRMSEGGILQATVRLPSGGIDLRVPRFYAPQAGEISFDQKNGPAFADAVLKRGEEEWGDLTAALGPGGGPEIQLLKTRLTEQREMWEESAADPEALRRIVEETRFIRQDIARMGKKHQGPLLQRQLGKMVAAYNRVARGKASKDESERFDGFAQNVQDFVDAQDNDALNVGALRLGDMRALFFQVAWRDPDYVLTWFLRLSQQPYLFPDAAEFKAMTDEGVRLRESAEHDKLKALVARMLDARISLSASDAASDLATIVKG